MGLADITLSTLESQTIRTAIEEEGGRVITSGTDRNVSSPLQIIGSLLVKGFSSVGGFLIKAIIGVVQISASAIWSFIVQTTQFIWNFDFNATDQQLDQYLNSMKSIIAGQLGGTLGNITGYFTCGVVPASAIFVFNEPLGLYLLKEVGEEMLDEFLGNLQLLTRSVFYLGVQYLLTSAYKSARRALKNLLSPGTGGQGTLASQLFGSRFDNLVQAWGNGQGVWSFSNSFNEAIESIPIPWLQNFTEEFFEEAFDACVEAGYVIANGIDDWIAKHKIQQNELLGQERAIELIPDRTAESERVVMIAPEQLLKPAMTQFMTQYALVENRDLGQFVGEPVREYVKSAPAKLVVRIVWSRFDAPPMFREGVYKPPVLEIKGFDRNKLDFSLIKQLMGGANGRFWGRFYASCALVDPDGAIVARPRLFAGSEDEAESLLTNLLTQLSDFEIATMTTGEERRIGRKARGRAMEKVTTRVYPAYLTIHHAQKVLNETEGRTQIAGTYKRRDQRLPLWVSQKPQDWDEIIQELLLAPGADSPTP